MCTLQNSDKSHLKALVVLLAVLVHRVVHDLLSVLRDERTLGAAVNHGASSVETNLQTIPIYCQTFTGT